LPSGAVSATVDLDLQIVERGAASDGYTNIMSVDLDADHANFTIYLDGAANVQMLMKTDLGDPQGIAVTAANSGMHHVHLEGRFQPTATFGAFVDDVRAAHRDFVARPIATLAPRIELGARDSAVRGKNEVVIDNFVVDLKPAMRSAALC
jgi:hypothetical protein